MPLYEKKEGIPPLMPGRIIALFGIDSVRFNGDKVVVHGRFNIKDMLADERSPKRNLAFLWRATARTDGGELSKWEICQQVGHNEPFPVSLKPAMERFISSELDLFLLNNPQVLIIEGLDLKPVPPKPAPVVDTAFPPDWANRTQKSSLGGKPAAKPVPAPVIRPLPLKPVNGNGGHRVIPAPAIPARVEPKPERKVIPMPKPARNPLVANVPRYTGLRIPYEGPCVCKELEESGPRSKFNWKEKTNGQFPSRCFECSCGARWWCSRPDEHWWSKVPDVRAWWSLCEHNGVPARTLAYKREEVYLESSLNDSEIESVHKEG